MTMTLEELSDREDIRILVATLATTGDVQDMDTYCGVFTEDGVLELPIIKAQGRENIRTMLTANPKARAARNATRHNITSSKTDMTGPTTAKGRHYFLVYYGTGADHMGHYEDQYVKLDGKWYLKHRMVYFDWVSEQSTNMPTEEIRRKMLSWS